MMETSTELGPMRRAWDRFARADAMFYTATRKTPWTRDTFFASGRPIVARALEWCGEGLGRNRALDLGCGLGRTAVHFARHFERVDALDISGAMIERARALDPPPNVHFAAGNGGDLALYQGGAFDLVFSALVFQHIRVPAVIAAYLGEIARVLKPAGRAVLQFDSRPRGPLVRIYEVLPGTALGRTRRRYLRRYRRHPETLDRMLAAAGLRVMDQRGRGSAGHFVQATPS